MGEARGRVEPRGKEAGLAGRQRQVQKKEVVAEGRV